VPHPLGGGRRGDLALGQTSPTDPAMAGRMVEAVVERAGEHERVLGQIRRKSESSQPPEGLTPAVRSGVV
jgi:hypothetical protein